MRVLSHFALASLVSMLAACGSDDDSPTPMDAGETPDAGSGDATPGDGGETPDARVDAPPGRDAGPPMCGNFEIEGDEVCDDGNTEGADGCSADCLSNEVCGNSYVDDALGEVCDDGNTINGDGCDATCMSDETCGNGVVDVGVGEVCDDGNTMDDDGCSADCSVGPTCGDGITNGGEACDDGNTTGGDGCSADCSSDESCGNGTVDTVAGEACDDGNTTAGDGCSATCAVEICGNSIVDAGEECDDGNDVAGDGCEGDCTFTCSNDTDCDDGAPCNGTETCNTTTNLCAAGTPLADATDCGGGMVCRGGACVAPVCGNSITEGAEDCDDGNTVEGDGCDNDCTFSCTMDAECTDGEVCTGDETCNTTTSTCVNPPDLADGTACGSGLVCRSGACVTAVCGNGIVEASEACDDGNGVDGDGCDGDCTFSCTLDTECDDGELCTGTETCNTTTNTCADGADPADGTACGSDLVCRSGGCTMIVCGDGMQEGSEECDDGNGADGDGCDNDCTFSCTLDTECDDAAPCNGVETCNTTTNACEDGPDAADGTSCGTGLVCRSGSCTTIVCGNTIVETGEDCDDGNTTNGDGCDNDCTFSCTTSADCTDGLVCNGAETCNTTTNVCAAGTPPADGTLCDRDMMAGTRDICRGGSCQASTCGDGFVDTGRGEECEDGNSNNGDGCDNDCTFSCTTNADCTDGLVCNGAETCNTSTNVCAAGTPAADGTLCDRDMMAGTRDVCISATCVASTCGDGYVDTGRGEECEDGNSVNGDGCDNDCTFSCTTSADCTDGLVCNGTETCNTSTNVCSSGTPPADGTVCDRDMMSGTRDICRSGTCLASSCGDGFVDTGGGEQCEDGNTTNGDGCDNDCTYSCTTSADCTDGRVCNGTETCNTTTHVCLAGTPPADGTLCDRDMNAGTRDICRSGTCSLSACGDGYLDMGGGEACDDGNLVNGDGCESNCQPTGVTPPTVYRIDQLDLRDPHIYAEVIGCNDITDSGPFGLGDGVNDSLNDSVDGFTLNYINVFRPLDRTMTTNPFDFVDGECVAGATRPSCQVGAMGTVYSTTATNMSAGSTCLAALAGTVRGYSPAVPTIGGPCFVTAPQNITVDIGGVLIPFEQARIAATYSAGAPPGSLGPGLIRGYLTTANAMAVVFPATAPGPVAGDTLFEHLAASGAPGSSCRDDRDDRDPHPVTGVDDAGFWFYLQFAAIRADWTGP